MGTRRSGMKPCGIWLKLFLNVTAVKDMDQRRRVCGHVFVVFNLFSCCCYV